MDEYNFLSSSDSDLDDDDTISVNKLTNLISLSLKKNLKYFYFIKGEILIGNNKKLISSRSGHFYFNIKDTKLDITLDCMLWKSTYEKNEKLKYICDNVINGDIVKVKIHIDHWKIKNKISIVVYDIEKQDDIGSFFNKRDQLFIKYKKLGYFNEKKNISLEKIKNIGLITAFGREAMSDFLKALKNRAFFGNIYIKPCIVQGSKCSKEITKAIYEFNKEKKVDIIIITRGGGSILDLWEFNDEKIIQAIYESKLPIGCGIGHEKDNTLCDHVCDISASTPTSIANTITLNKINYNDNLLIYKNNIQKMIYQIFEKQVNRLNNFINKFNNLSNCYLNKLDYNYNNLINKIKSDINYHLSENKINNIKYEKLIINSINQFTKLNDKKIIIELNDGIVECVLSSINIVKKHNNNKVKNRMKDLSKFIENINLDKIKIKTYKKLNYYNFINNYNIFELDIKDKILFLISEINKKKKYIKKINNNLNGSFKLKKNYELYHKYYNDLSNILSKIDKYDDLINIYDILVIMKKHLFYIDISIKDIFNYKKKLSGNINIITNFISDLQLNKNIINYKLLEKYKKCIKILNYNIELYGKSYINIFKNNINITNSVKI